MSGPIQNAIESKLTKALQPTHLLVENESRMHSVPPGSETHFKVAVVSAAFDGLSRVARHRKVHEALRDELAGGVHALSVHPMTPAEWTESSAVPASPACLGGSKGVGAAETAPPQSSGTASVGPVEATSPEQSAPKADQSHG